MTKYSLAASALLCTLLCAALCTISPSALAQTPAPAPESAHQHHHHAMAKPVTSTSQLELPSTGIWASYRKFSDPPLANWRQSNALVEQIGGWMAIAKETHGGMAGMEAEATKDKK